MSSDQEVILASLNTPRRPYTDRRAYDLAAACRQLKTDVIVPQEMRHQDGDPDPVDEIAAVLGAEDIHANPYALGVARGLSR
jgi:hypothetical protein